MLLRVHVCYLKSIQRTVYVLRSMFPIQAQIPENRSTLQVKRLRIQRRRGQSRQSTKQTVAHSILLSTKAVAAGNDLRKKRPLLLPDGLPLLIENPPCRACHLACRAGAAYIAAVSNIPTRTKLLIHPILHNTVNESTRDPSHPRWLWQVPSCRLPQGPQ